MTEPLFSISEITTVHASFAEDLAAYGEAGAQGIGIWESKLPDDDAESLALLRASGLAATNCVPFIPSILPMPGMDEPAEPAERIEALCASIRRLGPFEPGCVVCLTGPPGRLGDARRVVVGGLRRIAAEARAAGVRVGVEPVQREGSDDPHLITSLADTIDLLDEVGDDTLGILFDVWHLWNTEMLFEDIRAHGDRIVGVHVSDWREPTRGWADRALPGEGVAGVPEILHALDEAGWRGAYDLEIFSDDGVFGNAYEDSLWKLPARELARRGREAFLQAWREGVVQLR